ncbi:MAG: 2-oxo acid dehydrogenase subunit E2 [Rhodanobacteraceae bacterium]|nr:MAG: 2-oxo acid dehydrogenase subunit E2 [Rhodanobacteraceae bacterium]
MADNKTFHLPDLGEGLPDATIVEWLVKEGDSVKLDAPLVSMETAKAVVEVPSPYTGKVLKFHGAAGDVITTGAPLAEFELDPKGKQRAENAAGGHHQAPAPAPTVAAAPAARADEGTVVGAVASSNEVRAERVGNAGGVKAVPAVRAMAKKLKVDLARVQPTGAGGVVTLQDVKSAAASGTASLAAPSGRGGEGSGVSGPSSALPSPSPGRRREEQHSTLSHAGRPMRTTPPTVHASGQPEQLKGVRRNMARVMQQANAEVAQTTIVDDADLHQWLGKQDITVRTIRAIVAACTVEPALNAWFDGKNLTITRHPNVDLGIAVDTPDGLFVPALRNADMLDARGLREGINRLRAQVEDRSIPASELTGYTISLSNFGMFAGRYGTVVVVPPCVAIVGVGKLSHDVVAVMGGIEVHRRLPVSLTFDHRACTGGEAARFLKAILDDLALPQ